MRCAAAILTVLGGILTLTGLIWAAASALRRRRQVIRDRDAIDRATSENDESALATLPTTTWDDITQVRQLVELAILNDAIANLRGPAALALLGTVLSTVGGTVSLWL